MASVLVPLAPGFEEIEAITIIDVLRRADFDVTVAGLQAGSITGSHGITVEPDATLDQISAGDHDLIALPGGLPGAEHLAASTHLLSLLRSAVASGRTVAAICAAPMALQAAGMLKGRQVTSYPGVLDGADVDWVDQPVVIDGKIVTSMGPATAMEFSLTLVELLGGPECRQALEDRMLITAQG